MILYSQSRIRISRKIHKIKETIIAVLTDFCVCPNKVELFQHLFHSLNSFACISMCVVSFFSMIQNRANGTEFEIKETAMFITGLV